MSCTSSKPIRQEMFDGISEIKSGEKAVIKWKFKNANKVVVDNISMTFEPKDSIVVSPDESTKYKVTAMHETDTVSYFWRVNVIKQVSKTSESSKENESNQDISINESEYVKGIANTGNTPYYIKVMRVNESGSEYNFKALVLDRFGNYLTGFNSKDEIKLFNNCETGRNQILFKNVEEIELPKDSRIELGILVENSFNSKNINDLISNICKNLSTNYKDDFTSISYYNQKLNRILPMVSNSDIPNLISDKFVNYNFGLNALYKSITKYVDTTFKQSYSPNTLNALVAINFNSDNSSLEYFPEDAVKLCKQQNLPIYVIAVGSNADNYNLKLLTSATGGRFYSIPELSNDKVNEIINEIMFAQKKFFKFSMSKSSIDRLKCDERKLEINYDSQSYNIKESLKLPILDELFRIKYQSLCSFQINSSKIDYDFKDGIKSFSRVIKENPNFNIDLIGHSSNEGDEEMIYDLSLERANKVKEMMVAFGVNPNQIRVRAEGDKKPIFFIEQNEAQAYYNRRVELKLLDPAQKPYEIIAELVKSEADAQKKVEKWEDRGYSAYYERYLDSEKNPIYRIRIWGYGTEDDAEKELSNLKQKFALKFPLKVE